MACIGSTESDGDRENSCLHLVVRKKLVDTIKNFTPCSIKFIELCLIARSLVAITFQNYNYMSVFVVSKLKLHITVKAAIAFPGVDDQNEMSVYGYLRFDCKKTVRLLVHGYPCRFSWISFGH